MRSQSFSSVMFSFQELVYQAETCMIKKKKNQEKRDRARSQLATVSQWKEEQIGCWRGYDVVLSEPIPYPTTYTQRYSHTEQIPSSSYIHTDQSMNNPSLSDKWIITLDFLWLLWSYYYIILNEMGIFCFPSSSSSKPTGLISPPLLPNLDLLTIAPIMPAFQLCMIPCLWVFLVLPPSPPNF